MMCSRSDARSSCRKPGRAEEFEALGHIAATVPIRRVHAHSDAARLPRLCEMILEDFSSELRTRTTAALIG